MSNWCCPYWTDLGKELSEMKQKSLDKIIKKGIPLSTFSPILRLLSGITNYCPFCGCKLDCKPREDSIVTRQEPPPPKPAYPPIKCPPCKGSGKVGEDLLCATCFGTGMLDSSNPHRMRFDARFAEAQREKISSATDRIMQSEAEIAKNKTPMREDAKPEAVKLIR